MFPENRYVRERNERRTALARITNDQGKAELEKKQKSSPPPELKPLFQLEKRIPENYRPLPGGGFRRLDYEGLLGKKDLNRIEKNYPLYKEAESKTGVNWKVLAAVHYRESSLGKDPFAKGNEFQFDGVYKKRASGNLLHDAITAGQILQEKNHRAKKSPLLADEFAGEKVKEALFRYNGTLYRSSEKSPYVMNQFDEKHSDMKIFRGKGVRPRWGNDSRLGSYTVIRELTRAFVA